MKKIIALFIILATVLISFASCSEKVPAGKLAVDLYFSNLSKDSIVSETVYVDKSKQKNTVEFVKEIMNMLFAGPSSEGAVSVIPKATYLRGVSLSDEEEGTVNIDLSKEYYTGRSKDEAASEELLARYSIVYTLCQFEDIKKIKIYVDGKDMMASTGKDQVLAAFGKEGIMINSPSNTETKTEKFVTLYFTDKTGINLYPETHKATMTDNSIEKTVVNELIRGPVSDKYQRTFSDSTHLISAETKEGVCFVNFSDKFLSGIEGDLTAERTAVYSVVNSLARLPDIKKVQILIDGKKPESDTHQLFSIPLERDESMIVNIK